MAWLKVSFPSSDGGAEAFVVETFAATFTPETRLDWVRAFLTATRFAGRAALFFFAETFFLAGFFFMRSPLENLALQPYFKIDRASMFAIAPVVKQVVKQSHMALQNKQ
jgi:hypothetical protein